MYADYANLADQGRKFISELYAAALMHPRQRQAFLYLWGNPGVTPQKAVHS